MTHPAIAVARLGSVNNAPPRDGTFRDLETTGNLRLITDAELRSAVVTYFSQDLRAGRPAFDDRQDHRLRLFARENLPAEVTFNVFNLCPQETPAFTCDFADPPPMDRVWQRLADDPAMPDLLRSRQARRSGDLEGRTPADAIGRLQEFVRTVSPLQLAYSGYGSILDGRDPGIAVAGARRVRARLADNE